MKILEQTAPDRSLQAQVTQVVHQRFAELDLPARPMQDDDLREAGLTSLALVELIFLLEERFALTVPDNEVNPANFSTIGTLAQMIRRIEATAGQ